MGKGKGFRNFIILVLLGIAGYYLYNRFFKASKESVHFTTNNPSRFYTNRGASDYSKIKRGTIVSGERFYTFQMKYPWIISLKINESEMNRIQSTLASMGRLPLSHYGLRRDDPQLGVKLWHIIYTTIYKNSKPYIRNLANIFRRIQRDHRLNRIQTAYMALRFIQFMYYKRPGGKFDYYTPLRSLYDYGKGANKIPSMRNANGWHGAGDCDTKVVVLMLLLSELGYKTVMFHSIHYKHAMIGINIPGVDGDYIEIRGIKYYFTETTYKNWRIGQLPEKYSDKDYWVPMIFENTRPGQIVERRNRNAGRDGSGRRAPDDGGGFRERERQDNRNNYRRENQEGGSTLERGFGD